MYQPSPKGTCQILGGIGAGYGKVGVHCSEEKSCKQGKITQKLLLTAYISHIQSIAFCQNV